MQLIEHYEVPSGGVSSITFSAIAATFTDLVLVGSLRVDTGFVGADTNLAINGSSTGFSGRALFGTGTTTGSFAITTQILAQTTGASTGTANTFSNFTLYFPNYRSSVAKSFSLDTVTENNGSEAYQIIQAGLWSGTDPITSLAISPLSGSFLQYSSLSLYGILAGSDGVVSVS